jgi:hypothetical protein
MLDMELAGGAFIFLAFIVLYLFAVTYGLYSAKGSGIAQRPYGKGSSNLAHDRVAAQHLTRGTRA